MCARALVISICLVSILADMGQKSKISTVFLEKGNCDHKKARQLSDQAEILEIRPPSSTVDNGRAWDACCMVIEASRADRRLKFEFGGSYNFRMSSLLGIYAGHITADKCAMKFKDLARYSVESVDNRGREIVVLKPLVEIYQSPHKPIRPTASRTSAVTVKFATEEKWPSFIAPFKLQVSEVNETEAGSIRQTLAEANNIFTAGSSPKNVVQTVTDTRRGEQHIHCWQLAKERRANSVDTGRCDARYSYHLTMSKPRKSQTSCASYHKIDLVRKKRNWQEGDVRLAEACFH